MIVDKDNKVSLVPYLLIDECGNIRLKNNYKYFTQTQVSMYVIGATKCHFYVYSQCTYKKKVVIKVIFFL